MTKHSCRRREADSGEDPGGEKAPTLAQVQCLDFQTRGAQLIPARTRRRAEASPGDEGHSGRRRSSGSAGGCWRGRAGTPGRVLEGSQDDR